MSEASGPEAGPYRLVIEEEGAVPFAFSEDVTLGRELDNDLVIAGEEVGDFHARIEIRPRSVDLVPLPDCAVALQEKSIDARRGLLPGERFALGLTPIRFECVAPQRARQARTNQEAARWALAPAEGGPRVTFTGELLIGREADCALRIEQRHVSRHHARLTSRCGRLWLQDLDSANGTFVNGERLAGACWLFHGDVLAFDTASFQLISDDPELTPVTRFGPEPVSVGQPSQGGDDPGAPPATRRGDSAPATGEEGDWPVVLEDEPGPVLYGLSEPVAGQRFHIGFGRHLIGRAEEAALRLRSAGASQRHAELERGPDGVLLNDLISTNGTLVNGRLVHTVRLRHGDRLQFGDVSFGYHDPATAPLTAPWRRWWPLLAAGTAALLGGITLWLALGG